MPILLDMSQVRARCVGRSSNGRNRRVASLFGGLARLFGGVPECLSLLSHPLHPLAVLLTKHPGFRCKHSKPFGLFPAVFGGGARRLGRDPVVRH